MIKTNKPLITGISIIMTLLVSCKTTDFGSKAFDINGMIYDFSNRPVAHCEISLGKWYKGITDINGRFTFQKVSPGTYTVSGHKNGYEPYSEEIILKDRGQIIYIRIPSQNQLLNMVDEAIAANNFILAEEIAVRAYHIDKTNIEMHYYFAVIKFRQHQYKRAISYLETAKYLGSRDFYIEKFLTTLKELLNAEETK